MHNMRPLLLVALAAALTFTNATGIELVTLERVPGGGIQPQAVVDGSGRVHLLYFTGDPAAGDLFYVSSGDDGATFTSPLRVNSEAGSAIATGTIRGGHLALGRNGRPHVAWNGSARASQNSPVDPVTGWSGAQMFYTRLNATRTAFEAQRGLMQRTVSLDGGGAIAADATGHVYVAWHGDDAETRDRSESSRAVWITRSTDEGRTFTRESAAWKEPTGVCGCCALDLFVDGASVSMMYRAATAGVDRDIYFLTSSDRGQTFRGARIHPWKINACPMTSTSFARAGTRLLGAWETEAKIFVGELDPAGPSALNVREPAPSAALKKHPRLAVNARGESLVVWAEGTGWARGGSVAWQLLDQKGERTTVSGLLPGVPKWSFAAVVPRRDGGFVVFY